MQDDYPFSKSTCKRLDTIRFVNKMHRKLHFFAEKKVQCLHCIGFAFAYASKVCNLHPYRILSHLLLSLSLFLSHLFMMQNWPWKPCVYLVCCQLSILACAIAFNAINICKQLLENVYFFFRSLVSNVMVWKSCITTYTDKQKFIVVATGWYNDKRNSTGDMIFACINVTAELQRAYSIATM